MSLTFLRSVWRFDQARTFEWFRIHQKGERFPEWQVRPSDDLPGIAEELTAKPADVYYLPHTLHRNGRNTEHITQLNAAVLDLDGPPLDDALDALRSRSIRPHYIVETSPGRYQLVILQEPIRLTKNTRKSYLGRQERVIRALYELVGGDPHAAHVGQLFRMPGTTRPLEGMRFLVRLIGESSAAGSAPLTDVSPNTASALPLGRNPHVAEKALSERWNTNSHEASIDFYRGANRKVSALEPSRPAEKGSKAPSKPSRNLPCHTPSGRNRANGESRNAHRSPPFDHCSQEAYHSSTRRNRSPGAGTFLHPPYPLRALETSLQSNIPRHSTIPRQRLVERSDAKTRARARERVLACPALQWLQSHTIATGHRNAALVALCYAAAMDGISFDEAFALVVDWRNTCTEAQPHYTDAEARATLVSCYRNPKGLDPGRLECIADTSGQTMPHNVARTVLAAMPKVHRIFPRKSLDELVNRPAFIRIRQVLETIERIQMATRDHNGNRRHRGEPVRISAERLSELAQVPLGTLNGRVIPTLRRWSVYRSTRHHKSNIGSYDLRNLPATVNNPYVFIESVGYAWAVRTVLRYWLDRFREEWARLISVISRILSVVGMLYCSAEERLRASLGGKGTGAQSRAPPMGSRAVGGLSDDQRGGSQRSEWHRLGSLV